MPPFSTLSVDEDLRAADRRYFSAQPAVDVESFVEPQFTNENPYFHAAVNGTADLITLPEDTLAVMSLFDEAARRDADSLSGTGPGGSTRTLLTTYGTD